VAIRSAATSQRGRFFASGVPGNSRARIAHAAIDDALIVGGDEIDESSEHCLVNRPVVGILVTRPPAERLHELVELSVHVMPLA
jgi:hypothetical protein